MTALLIAAGALRQYRHNNDDTDFVFGYDKDIVDREFDRLQAQLAEASKEPSHAEQALRRLLACRCAGALLYTDDGEMQDTSTLPWIDFKRDPVDVIEAKLAERTRRELASDHCPWEKPFD